MNKHLICILTGLTIGLLEFFLIIPRDGYLVATVSLTHWVGASILITSLSIDMKPWLKGIYISMISGIPIMIFLGHEGKLEGPIVMFIVTFIFGALMGWLPAKFGRKTQ